LHIKKKLFVIWHGLPICSLRVKSLDAKFYYQVVGLESFHKIDILMENNLNVTVLKNSWSIFSCKNLFSIIRSEVILISGWNNILHTILLIFIKFLLNKKIILMSDNIYLSSKKQKIGKFLLKNLYLNRVFNGVLVSGISAFKYARIMGFKNIAMGYYGYSSDIFNQNYVKKKNINLNFIFVGSFIERKGLLHLIEVINEILNAGKHQVIFNFIGSGPLSCDLVCLKARFPDKVILKGEKQGVALANAMRQADFLLAPSILDHWATVVSESIACGVIPLVSKTTFSYLDLIPEKLQSKLTFNEDSISDLKRSVLDAIAMSVHDRNSISSELIKINSKFNEQLFADGVNYLVES